MRRTPAPTGACRARAGRRALATLFALSTLGAGVVLPAAPVTSQLGDDENWGDVSTDLVTHPDSVRLSYSEEVTLYMRANDEAVYKLCEGYYSDNCDIQVATCGTVSALLERINERADEARRLLIAQGVRDIVTTDRDEHGDPIPRDDVRLHHLLDKLLPILPLRYRFLNPDVDPPDARDASNPQGEPGSYRHPDVTTALEDAATDAGVVDDDGDGSVDDEYVAAITTVEDVKDLPAVILDRLSDELTQLEDPDVSEEDKLALIAAVREALRVDPGDWPLHVHATLALLDRYLDRGLADAPATSHTSGGVGKKFFLLEDIPFDILVMSHYRFDGSGFYLWPWSRANWTGGFLAGLLDFLGIEQPDLAPIRDAMVTRKDLSAVATRPVERVVVRMAQECRPWHISNELGLRQVGPSRVDATLDLEFGPLRPHEGPPINRTVFVNRHRKVLLPDASGGDAMWEFPDSFYESVPNFFGPRAGTVHPLAHRFWLRLDVPGSTEDRYVHASYLSLRYDDAGTSGRFDDEWDLLVEGESDPVHTFRAFTGNTPYLQSATPWRSAVEPHGVTQSRVLGEWVPGGVIELSAVGLGELALEYCLSYDVTGANNPVCDRDWEQVTVMVEPEGWDDARAWANDDDFRLLVNWTNKQVVLLQEASGGEWTIDGVDYDLLERLCCLSDEDAGWSLDFSLPVMGNDTVRFFRGGRLLDRWGNRTSAGSITLDDQAACAGSRYCTFLRPQSTGSIDTGGFGLSVRPYFTSLELEVSAPPGDFDKDTETRHFRYCLAHRDETCSTTPATCAVATYAESPRAPNAPAIPALTTADIPSHHFVTTDLCIGADAEVSLTIDVFGDANPPEIDEEIWEDPAPEPDPDAGPRRCYDSDAKKWRLNDLGQEGFWFLDPTDPALREPPTAWCGAPQRVPTDFRDLGTDMWRLRNRWHEFATGRYNTTDPDSGYWTGPESNEADWKAYWSERLPHLQSYLDEDWLEGCQRTRPTDTWIGRNIGGGALLLSSAGTRWQNAHYFGSIIFWPDRRNRGDDLLSVGRPLIEEDREVCEGAKPRIVAVWGTHLGADNWITGSDPCELADDRSCVHSHGAAMQFGEVAQHLGDGWHERLAQVEPCIGAAECDNWVPPIPGWYQVRIEVAPPSVPLRSVTGDIADRDALVDREVCEDRAVPDPHDPDNTIIITECETVQVMWTLQDPFVVDDLVWVEDFYIDAM